jgi:uncharacterized protein YuzE
MASTPEIEMSVDYDRDEDVLYVYSGAKVKESIEVLDDIVVDIDRDGKFVGLEMFDAHKFLGTLNEKITKDVLENIKTAKVRVKNYRNYVILTLMIPIGKSIVEEKLPAFSLSKYESPLVASAA